MMTALIVEDEILAARRLIRLIQQLDASIKCVGPVDSVEGTLEWLSSHPTPDLIFMDIHLSDGSSFEVFSAADVQTPVIFTTAYDKYALDAFQLHTVDYLLKPIKVEELERALNKFQLFSSYLLPDYQKIKMAPEPEEILARRFLVKSGSKMQVVKVADASWFCTQNKNVYLVTQNGRKFALDFSMEKLEEMLDPKVFFRINRQFIVHIDRIGSVVPYTKGRVKLELSPSAEEEVVVSAEKSPLFKKWLTGQ